MKAVVGQEALVEVFSVIVKRDCEPSCGPSCPALLRIQLMCDNAPRRRLPRGGLLPGRPLHPRSGPAVPRAQDPQPRLHRGASAGGDIEEEMFDNMVSELC